MFIESSILAALNWRPHLILLIFLCSVCMGWPIHPLVGQNGYPFQFFGQEEGLSSASVRTLLQDKQGFVWVGSDNGLDRFDGRGFLSFRFDPEDPNSLTSNRVNGLSLDAQQRLWIGTSNGLCYLDLKSGVIKRVAITGSAVGPVPYDIKALLVDRNGSIWVGTLSNGLFKLSPKGGGADYDKQQFLPDPTDSNSLVHPSVTYLFQQDEDHLWISTSGGICRLHVESGIFTPRVDTALLKVDQGIRSLTADENGHIVFPLADVGIYHIDPSEIPLIPRPYLEFDLLGASGQAEMYLSAIQDRKGQLWVGTDRGVFLVDPDKQKYRSIDQAHLVRCFLEGQDGIMWAGFGRAGIGREDRMMDPYRYYQHDPQNPNSVSPGQVRTMTEDRQGKLWVGYLYEGLDQFSWDERKQEFINLQRIRHKPNQIGGLASNAIIEIFRDSKGFLWIATNGDGLNKLDPVTGKMETYLHDPDNPTSLSGNRIWGLSEDRNGYIWVGEFTTGLNRLDPATGVVKRFQHQSDNPNSLSHNRIKSMFMDSEGNLWIGTNGGLNRLDVETEQFARYLHSTVDSTTLSGNVIFSIYEDASQNLWVGTTLGLNKLTAVIGQEKRSTPHIERIYESSGLPSNSILGIQGDGQGKLWISTDNGVAKLIESGAESRFVVINNHDGLEYAQFLNKAHYYSKKREEFYFGSRQGLLVLPNQQNDRKVLPSQLLVSTVSKQTMDSRGGKKWSNPFINIKEGWNLNHRDRIISIKLSDFNWDKNRRYEYLLKGFDDNWLELPENMELTYTNLEAGKYTLFARLLSDDPASHAEVQLLQIRMSPPWWQTIWAYSLYLIAILAGVYGFYQFQWQQELKRQETENLRALDRFKNQLYTNITHEFKTPLTVISGMIEHVSGHDKVKRVVRRNSKNLLDLVNQILDLRKLELGKVRLDWVQADVVLYCQYVLESYEALADIKGVSLHFIPRQRGMLMDIDKEKLLRILSNLLSNAIKFTPAGGNVYLSLEEVRLQQAEKDVVPWLKFAVKDTGVGIPMEDQAFIFDRFYQVETDELRSKGEQKEKYRYRGPGGGNGIGLALTKDLVHFMDGRIELESEEGKGTTFTVWLPVKQTAVKEEEEELNIPIPDLSQAEMESLAEIEATPSTALNGVGLQVLVVEDNRDVRHYLVTLLQGQYQVFIAKDGQEGADKAFELIPDIIISDVMMPKKDGFELCRELKSDFRTSHIPIILLTSKSSVESRIQGLQEGADAYLSKPFNHEELFVRIRMLLEVRKRLQDRYLSLSDLPLAEPVREEPFALEDAFIAKLKGVIEANMHRSSFTVPELCREMGVSRSLLHRKLKALTNKPTSYFIRLVRLEKAKELLKDPSLNVTQVAYEVGFSDISYFSKCFTEEYGLTPSDYRAGV